MTTPATQVWDGTRLGTEYVALVLLTADALGPGGAPRLALAGASDGQTAWVVPPGRLGAFLRVHDSARLLCPNAGELHRVLHAHLGAANDPAAQQALRRFAAEGRLVDLSLLDQLVRLAEDGCRRPPRLSLQELARGHAGLPLAGAEALRREIASAPRPGAALAAEAGRQAQAVVKVFEDLRRQAHARRLAVIGGGQQRFGLLSLALQVQADVALAHARQNGLHLAPGAMLRIVAACKSARDRSAATLLADRDACQWLHLGPDGQAKLRPDGSPQVRSRELRPWLRKVSDSILGLHQTEFAPPTKAGGPSEDPEDWGGLLRYHRLLGAWSDLMLATEAGRSCAGAAPSGARPGYEVLPRLRLRGPDLDALRRFGVAGAFVPAPGHVFLAVTPRDLELRALAAVCRQRLGRSTLADLFDRGDDPCEHAAAALAETTPGAFAALRQRSPAEHRRWLLAARALLAVAPAGLSVDRVCEVVREQPGLAEVGLAEVTDWHRRLLADVFSELAEFLSDDTLDVMASNLGTTVASLQEHLGTYFRPTPPLPQLREWYAGYGGLAGRTKDCLRALLDHCCGNPDIHALVRRGVAGDELYFALFSRSVAARTGRVRGRLPFSQARAAEYLDRADDVGKSAVSAVAAGGFTVAAYADGTILVELSDTADTAGEAERARELARQGAEEALGGVRAECDAELLARW